MVFLLLLRVFLALITNFMFNYIIKNTLKKIAFKIATDSSIRNKVKVGIIKTKELKAKGELLKTLGKVAGRAKSKIK